MATGYARRFALARAASPSYVVLAGTHLPGTAMIRFASFAIAFAVAAPLFAEDKPAAKVGAEGYWVATLSIGAVELRLGLKIESKDGNLTGSIDAIDQEVKGIPIEKVEFTKGTLTLKMPAMK